MTPFPVQLLVSQSHQLDQLSFEHLPKLLQPGDLLVVNDSATLPASIQNRLHYSGQLEDGSWLVEPRQPQGIGTIPLQWQAERLIDLPELGPRRLTPWPHSNRLWRLQNAPADPVAYLSRQGQPIRYAHTERELPLSAYQSYFARVPGSAEMPSAGRPFTDQIVAELDIASLTLHTGVSSLEQHEMPYPESFRVPEETWRRVKQARRVIAVGTTVLRALETAAGGQFEGWTRHIVTPQNFRQSVAGLLTGMHDPASTHRWMLQALLSNEELERAYQRTFRSHEFGDMHLIIK
jgi:S-adenosylmethionine:tRNA ribosyltransferase-isomerase